MELLIVGIGGFFGAITRYLVYLVEKSLAAHIFPLGTLAINLLGCFLAGLLLALIERAAPMNKYFVLLASTGFIGSFTTFSTFSIETLTLVRNSQTILAILNIGANVVFGVLAVWMGRLLIQTSL